MVRGFAEACLGNSSEGTEIQSKLVSEEIAYISRGTGEVDD